MMTLILQYGIGILPIDYCLAANATSSPTAGEFHDIAPPVNYSLIPMWLIFAAAFVGLTVVGLSIWLFVRSRRAAPPAQTPRQRALEVLDRMQYDVERVAPYRFSIRVSDVLRRYVTEQYSLPVTRQTSVEFLTALAQSSSFSQGDKSLLEDFLTRCDLIKFARYDATSADSRLLIDEATRFVQGGELAPA
jgi:Domain of unknown function (DUF4381)